MKITSKLFLTMTAALSMVSFSAMARYDDQSEVSSSVSHAAPALNGVIGAALDEVVTQEGTGTLTLSGANTYSGGTTINAGTLTFSVDASNTGKITVRSGSVLQVSQQRYNEIRDRLEVEEGGRVEIQD